MNRKTNIPLPKTKTYNQCKSCGDGIESHFTRCTVCNGIIWIPVIETHTVKSNMNQIETIITRANALTGKVIF